MWYGARSIKENIYQEEYEELDRKHENFSYHLVLSEPLPEDLESGWNKDDPLKKQTSSSEHLKKENLNIWMSRKKLFTMSVGHLFITLVF